MTPLITTQTITMITKTMAISVSEAEEVATEIHQASLTKSPNDKTNEVIVEQEVGQFTPQSTFEPRRLSGATIEDPDILNTNSTL